MASALARQGYVVIVIDMFYWGARRILLEGDPEDWRTRPRTMPNARVASYNQRSQSAIQLSPLALARRQGAVSRIDNTVHADLHSYQSNLKAKKTQVMLMDIKGAIGLAACPART